MNSNLSVLVGDFGLARDIYSSEYYCTGKGARLPAKWMPPETLTDGISNEKTDVVRDLHYKLNAHIHCTYATLLYLLLVLAEDIHTLIQKSLFMYLISKHYLFPSSLLPVVIWCHMLGGVQSGSHSISWY